MDVNDKAGKMDVSQKDDNDRVVGACADRSYFSAVVGSKYKMRSSCFDGQPLGNSRQPERPLFQSWEMEMEESQKAK